MVATVRTVLMVDRQSLELFMISREYLEGDLCEEPFALMIFRVLVKENRGREFTVSFSDLNSGLKKLLKNRFYQTIFQKMKHKSEKDIHEVLVRYWEEGGKEKIRFNSLFSYNTCINIYQTSFVPTNILQELYLAYSYRELIDIIDNRVRELNPEWIPTATNLVEQK